MKKIIVIAAHPDDETIGVGGTLLKHKANGDDISWLIVTNITENNGVTSDVVSKRDLEIAKVADMFGFTKTYELKYPTTTLTDLDLISLIPRISQIFEELKPEIIYTMNRSDAHSDHRLIFEAVLACTKSFRYPFIREVLMYECISETEFAPALPEKAFIPNCFIDVTSVMDKKIEIMEKYESEIGVHPFPRSERNLRALATFRGAVAGVEYAEAFQIIKLLKIEHL